MTHYENYNNHRIVPYIGLNTNIGCLYIKITLLSMMVFLYAEKIIPWTGMVSNLLREEQNSNLLKSVLQAAILQPVPTKVLTSSPI